MPRKTTTTSAKPAAKRTTARRTAKAPVAPTWEHVATRAYFIHLETGGDPLENWLRAERELI